MEKLEKIKSISPENIEYFLTQGPQTELTERISEIAASIEGSFEEKVAGIFEIISEFPFENKNKNDIFRKRTVDQILSDRFVTGCTDVALIFIALSRAKGIPAKYVETIDTTWIQNGDESITGHVYVNVFDGQSWRIIDPMKKVLDANPEQEGRVIFKEGLDSWDIGIDSFDELSKQFNNFRDQSHLKKF